MVKEIMHDPLFLAGKSEPATKEDAQVIQDLLDTLEANKERCVGMAANMIGVKKNIIVYSTAGFKFIMVNPKITKKIKPYKTEEGCLSLSGVRETTRYQEIEVEYLDKDFNPKKGKYAGWIAQIIQHECDHLQGIII